MVDRCEPPEELRGVDGWHWLETLDGRARFCHRWWKARGVWGWATIDARSLTGMRYLAPVATPAEVEALRAERDALKTGLLDQVNLASEERRRQEIEAIYGPLLDADRALITTLRARVAELEAAIEGIANWCEAYPATVFTQAGADRALEACKAAGIPTDAMHGTWGRHLLAGIGRDARAALEPRP